jgi:hypothetical protein
MGSASEGYEGRTGYVDETAGAYYASRLGVLEHLAERRKKTLHRFFDRYCVVTATKCAGAGLGVGE